MRSLLFVLMMSAASVAMAADPAYLLKEINQNVAPFGSYPDRFLPMGNICFFDRTDGQRNPIDLWRTDGTSAGTFRVGGQEGSRVVWNNRLWFVPPDYSASAGELWSTDGASAATLQFKFSVPIKTLMATPSYLYFFANGTLWRSDGTLANTFSVSTVSMTPLVDSWVNRGDTLFFVGKVTGSGFALWRSDVLGVALLNDPGSTTGDYFSAPVLVGNNLILLRIKQQASGTANAMEWWRSDGTAAGTAPLRPFAPIRTIWSPLPIVSSGTNAYFVGDDGTGRKLWSTDGTDTGTVALASSLPGASATFDAQVLGRLANGTLILFGPTPNQQSDIGGLWAFDGTNTTFLIRLPSGNESTEATVAGGYALFGAGADLIRTDGTPSNTFSLGQLNGSNGYSNWPMAAVGGTVFFGAAGNQAGAELWKTDGSIANTAMVKDVLPATYGSYPSVLQPLRGGVVFLASSDGQEQYSGTQDLWFSDGTEVGTQKILVGVGAMYQLTKCGASLYFQHFTPELGGELWSTDGTAAGTSIVSDIYPGPDHGSPGNFACVDGHLLFTANARYGDVELWRSDGSAASTVLIRTLAPSYFTSRVSTRFFVLGHRIYFGMTNPFPELWQSDGTAAGTTRVKQVSDAYEISSIVVSASRVYFTTWDTNGDTSLWRSDTTESGTEKIVAGSLIPTFSFGEGVAFAWYANYSFNGLFFATTAAPVCFDTIHNWSTMTMQELNGSLYYNLPQLWKTADGVTSSNTGVGNVDQFLATAAGRLYGATPYSYPDGYKLIETDGSPSGSRTILSRQASSAVASGGRLFISSGELYAYDLPVTPTSFAPQSVATTNQSITISGRGFTAPAAVVVGSSAAAVISVSDTGITFLAPSLEPGTYVIHLSLGDGRAMVLDDPLRYTCTPPTASVDPIAGLFEPFDPITLHGSGGVRCAWFPGDGLDDPSSCTPHVSISRSTTYALVVYNDQGCASVNFPAVRIRVTPAAPTAVRATLDSTGAIYVTWNLSQNAVSYEVTRYSSANAVDVMSTNALSYADHATTTSMAYVYRIRAAGAEGFSRYSGGDFATTFSFTDPILQAGMIIRAAHITELRSAIDAIRVASGLTQFPWTDSSIDAGVTVIRSAHILDLRSALLEVFPTLGLTPPGGLWSGAAGVGTVIRASDVRELRDLTR